MSILVKPILTEKTIDHGELFNRYWFVVDKNANKIEIKNEVELLYGVSVDSVRTLIYPVKRKSKHTKKGTVTGTIGSYKKAIVQIAEGDRIDFYSSL